MNSLNCDKFPGTKIERKWLKSQEPKLHTN